MKNAPKGQKQKVEPGWVTPLNAQPSQKANKKVEAKVANQVRKSKRRDGRAQRKDVAYPEL